MISSSKAFAVDFERRKKDNVIINVMVQPFDFIEDLPLKFKSHADCLCIRYRLYQLTISHRAGRDHGKQIKLIVAAS
jgi:hypothetical protein